MTARAFALVAGAALIALFLALNVASGALMRGWRIDATANRLHTLSDGARQTVRALREPVVLTLYYSREAAADQPALQSFAGRVRDLLAAFAAASGGRVRLEEVDPRPFSPAEDRALEAGLAAAPLGARGQPFYLGLTASDAQERFNAIPLLNPEREASLEYDVARLIADLGNPRRPKVAVITALPWLFQPQQTPEGLRRSAIAEGLDAAFAIEVLDGSFDRIPADADVLFIAHPPVLSAFQQYLVDQHLMTRGRALIALDPAAQTAPAPGFGPTPSSTRRLGPVLAALGAAVSEEVVIDRAGALPVQGVVDGRTVVVPQPLYWRTGPDGLAAGDLITQGLGRGVFFASPGAITPIRGGATQVAALAQSSADAALTPAGAIGPDPQPRSFLDGFRPDGVRHAAAARITGRPATAFPAGAPSAPAPLPGAQGPAPLPAPVARAQRDVDVVLIADADFMNDGFHLGADGAPIADNVALVLNALDLLAGDNALVSLRSRAPATRPLEVVERMRAQAQARLATEQEGLQVRLEATQAALRDLEAKGAGSGFFQGREAALTPAEQAEVERFRTDLVEIRARLREIERGWRADVEALKAWLIAINVWLVPALVGLAGLVVLRRRARAGALR
jgi:ABC-2 type transport system permease protein